MASLALSDTECPAKYNCTSWSSLKICVPATHTPSNSHVATLTPKGDGIGISRWTFGK